MPTTHPNGGTMPRRNIAARAGHWSATNRKKAIFGWLAFVLIATVLGGMVGTQTLAQEDQGNGQSQVADRAVADAGFPEEAGEQILLQGKGTMKSDDPAFAAAARDVARRIDRVAHV